MRSTLVGIICAWVVATGFISPLMADQIVLHSGEIFNSPKIWEAGDKIHFDMNGLTVSVKKEDVRAIIRHQDASAPLNSMTAPGTPESATRTDPHVHSPTVGENPHDTGRSVAKPQPTPVLFHNASRHPLTRSIRGTGMKDLVWRAPPSSLPGLVKIKTEPAYGGVDQYRRPQDDLRIGKARLDGMVYGFWKNQLYSVTLWVDGRPGYQILKKTIRTHYGDGQPSESGQERYVWRDKDSDRMLEFDDQLNTGIFWMRSRSLDREIKRLYPD
jgi:hypothetical protein